MTKYAKKPPPKFTGELGTPILAALEMQGRNDEGTLRLSISPAFIEQLRKLEFLAAHYNALRDGKIDFFVLSFAMAKDLVPGFQILYDDPIARDLNLPNAYRGKTKPKGAGKLRERASGQDLITLFHGLQKAFPDRSEVRLSEMIAECLIPDLAGPQRASDRKRTGKTLRNRLAIARRKFPAAQD